jgi:phosphoribosylformylglycinamidine (FGAM) synthase PurS component
MIDNGNIINTNTAKYFKIDVDEDDDDDCGDNVGDAVGALTSVIVSVSVADTPLNTDDDNPADEAAT